MLTLPKFLKLLPGIMPNKSRDLVLSGDLLSEEIQADIYSRDKSLFNSVQLVGPDAAEAILAAYKSGRLPMKKGQQPTSAPDATAYIETSEKLRPQIAESRRKVSAIKDPSKIREDDLTDYQLIDQVFIQNIGMGSGSMVLAGIKVEKRVTAYKSNSGKTNGWHVHFHWIGSDGRARFCEKTPSEMNNRRNDPERNWGLHE